jgi:hypothetical protein
MWIISIPPRITRAMAMDGCGANVSQISRERDRLELLIKQIGEVEEAQ